jgi:RNA polymerase sigma-70 factor, ECF subfamily
VSADQDRQDIERVLAGDPAAFEGIVRRWQGPLVNLAWRFCRDRGRAEDLAQEAFLRAFHGLPSFKGDATFSTWLFALATNLYRSSLRRFIPPSVNLDGLRLAADAPSPDDAMDARRRAEALRRAVSFLPPRYRDSVVLYYFHDMSVALAAASLGLPEGTVKAHLARGRELLRKKLGAKLAPRSAPEGA